MGILADVILWMMEEKAITTRELRQAQQVRRYTASSCTLYMLLVVPVILALYLIDSPSLLEEAQDTWMEAALSLRNVYEQSIKA